MNFISNKSLMMASDTEEDFPLNAGSDKLAKLFEDNTLDDISFKFSLPKHPSTRHKPVQNTVPLKVIHGKTVEAFQMKIGGYKSEGKVGIAIIGNDEYFYYQLYMYRSDERKVASAEISFQFSFLVQEHNYASFKDSLGIQWSVHFDQPSDLVNFAKEIALARWRSTPSCQCKLIQEAYKGKTENIVKRSDNVKVNYTVYKLSPENTLHEDSSERVISAPANSTNWEINLIGMCLKSKRFIIIPSQQCESEVDLTLPHGVHVMLELEIEDITPFGSETNQSSCSLGILNPSSKRSIEKKEESSSLSERMSRIGYALPNIQTSETESSYDISDKIKPTPQKTSTPASLTSVVLKEDYSSDAGDITVTSQFNVLFSEVRTNNSEIRMNISRVNDKIDMLFSKIEFSPEINHKIVPMMEKLENMDGFLNRIVEQNNVMASLLEKNSLSSFQTALNDVIQLKKRNSELETLLEVAGSTSQILKEKVDELNKKLLETEQIKSREDNNVCGHCNGSGDRMIKTLEQNVRVLEEKNIQLLQTTEELERQNRELSEHTMSAIQGHSNLEMSFQLRLLEKDKRIENLERDVDRLNTELKKRCTRQAVEKEITEVAKALMNKAYKTLKSVMRDSTVIDHSFADALREMTRNYLENHFEQKCPSLFEQEEPCRGFEDAPSQENYEQQGKLPLPPNISFPVPRPRKPTNLKQPLTLASESHPKVTNDNIKTEIPLTNNKTTESKGIGIDNKCLSKNSVINKVIEHNDVSERQILSEPVSDANVLNSLKNNDEVKNNNLKDQFNDNNIVDSNENVDKDIESIVSDITRRFSIDSDSSKSESFSSPYQTSYSSNFYAPLIPTTPPPIIDDNSD